MKKIIFVTVFCIFLVIGGVIFGIQNFSTTKITKRDFIVVKGSGEFIYPYRYTFPKGTKAIDVISSMKDIYKNPKKISIKKGKKWKEVYNSEKLYHDTTIKAEF